MKPTVSTDQYDLYLGDCLDILPGLGKVDAVVTDPPYGIKESSGKAKTRISGLTAKVRDPWRHLKDYGNKTWDSTTLDDEVKAARAIAEYAIIFGGNYYRLPPTSCWLVWDKENSGDFADCELAWTNLKKAVRRIKYHWNGCMRKERNIERVHPTQKPEGVMRWCIAHLPDTAHTILDPFMGSGTTGVACMQLGRKFIGIEIDPDYFEIAHKRIRDAAAQGRLALDKPDPPKQERLL